MISPRSGGIGYVTRHNLSFEDLQEQKDSTHESQIQSQHKQRTDRSQGIKTNAEIRFGCAHSWCWLISATTTKRQIWSVEAKWIVLQYIN